MRYLAQVLVVLVAAGAVQVQAAEFRSIRAPGAVAYDAPSDKARKLYIFTAAYPVELVVTLEGWRKVRDAEGALTWVSEDRLSTDAYVLVMADQVAVRAAPGDSAAVVFQAQKGVVLKVLESPPGWIKAQHIDGAVGFVRSQQVWGR